jgi:hypothetical protein
MEIGREVAISYTISEDVALTISPGSSGRCTRPSASVSTGLSGLAAGRMTSSLLWWTPCSQHGAVYRSGRGRGIYFSVVAWQQTRNRCIYSRRLARRDRRSRRTRVGGQFRQSPGSATTTGYRAARAVESRRRQGSRLDAPPGGHQHRRAHHRGKHGDGQARLPISTRNRVCDRQLLPDAPRRTRHQTQTA